jgi:tetratricopeptide (TPR) repeat protein
MIIDDPSKKVKRNILLLSAVAVVVVAAVVGVIFFGAKMFQISKENQKQSDYVIQGIPYIGIYNHKGDYSFSYVLGDTSMAAASLLEYWNPGQNNLVQVALCFSDINNNSGRITGLTDIEGCISKFGDYNFQTVHLNTDELKKYVNSEVKTPLIFFLPVSIDQPLEISYHPATLLIGIEDSQKKVILHDFWFGNNYEVSFDDFNKLWEGVRPDGRNTYLVVQPKDLQNKLKEIDSRKITAYPARTSIMDQAHSMFQNYALGWGAKLRGTYDVAQKYYSEILNDPKFEDYFPPYFKVSLFTKLADVYLAQGNLDQAFVNATKAVELNHDLDKPFKDWLGCELRGGNTPGNQGVSSDAYRILGAVYRKQKKYQAAIDNYQKALDINPGNPNAEKGLKLSQLGLAGEVK